jgi:hypothetical protein
VDSYQIILESGAAVRMIGNVGIAVGDNGMVVYGRP